MELFDILSQDGQKTGQNKPRDQVHQVGDWHASVAVFVVNSDNQILLQKRSSTKEAFPNLWEISCSGHLNAGEDSLTAAIRELAEEVGIQASPKQLLHLFKVKEPQVLNDGHFLENEFKDVYLLKLDLELETLALQVEEVSDVCWISFDALEQKITQADPAYVPHPEIYPRFFTYFKA